MAGKRGDGESLRCIFDNRAERAIKKLIAEPTVYIWEDGGTICLDISAEEREPDEPKAKVKLPKPVEIREFLDEYVIGQDKAKKKLAVAVYNHYKRNEMSKRRSEVEVQKSNILLVGPTGTGKTLLAQTLAKLLSVPFAIVDATTLTEAGYVGEDVKNILLRLLQAAGNDIEKAKRGIIYIDEVDKISRKSDSPSITRDVSGEGVQRALLKILEGTVANVPPQGGRKHPHQDFIPMDTTNILFICGGAFVGLENIIEQRTGKKSMGFKADVRKKSDKDMLSILEMVQPADLIKYGLIPEFVGRLPVIGVLGDLDTDTPAKILTQPRNALIKQYQKIFEYENVTLTFTKDALEAIAEQSLQRKIGARGLRLILEDQMLDLMYQLPSRSDITECVITKEVVENKTAPIVLMEKAG